MSNYNAYLQSKHWKEFRAKIIEERGCCEKCGSTERLHIHHVTYDNLGKEKPDDVMCLCNSCHYKIHDCPPLKPRSNAYFVKLYKTNLIQIASEKAKEKKLDLNEAGLFFMLISISGWQTPYIMHPETNKLMSCSAIADFLGLSRKNTFNLIERLISKGMISKVYNGNGRANHYMINPNVAFWGKTIDDTGHMDVFKDCSYEPEIYINYRKTPENKK